MGSDVLASKDVQDFVRARVPDYMVPASVVVLDALPRTPNGKVDRRALPAPTVSAGEGTARAVQTPVEQQLMEIWAEVPQMDRIEVDDNFFEIGGDSILSIQIISRANRAGIQLKPSQFFDHPTIAALARVATTEAAEAALAKAETERADAQSAEAEARAAASEAAGELSAVRAETESLERLLAREAGAEIRTGVDVISISPSGEVTAVTDRSWTFIGEVVLSGSPDEISRPELLSVVSV